MNSGTTNYWSEHLFDAINFVFVNLEGRGDPLATGALLARKDNLADLNFAFRAFELFFVLQLLCFVPAGRLDKVGAAVPIAMQKGSEQYRTTPFASKYLGPLDLTRLIHGDVVGVNYLCLSTILILC